MARITENIKVYARWCSYPQVRKAETLLLGELLDTLICLDAIIPVRFLRSLG